MMVGYETVIMVAGGGVSWRIVWWRSWTKIGPWVL